MANLGANFYPKLVAMTKELGMKPEDLISVMISESGMNPAAHNPGGGASGLIQFMPSTLKGLGFQGSPTDFRTLSGEEQLPWIKKLIKGNMSLQGGKTFTSGGHYYVANLWPVALKLSGVQKGDPDTIIIEKHPQGVEQNGNLYSKKYLDVGSKIPVSSEMAAYNGNPLFDKDKKGYITLGDLNRQVAQNQNNPIYRKSLLSMNEATGYQPQNKPSVNYPPQNNGNNEIQNLDQLLDRYVQMLSASASSNFSLKRLYKQALPQQNILIKVSSPDFTDAVEFARILCLALDQELLADTYPHTNGQEVEVQCQIAGPKSQCFSAVQEMTQIIVQDFQQATKKIGNIHIQTQCCMNKRSSYQAMSLNFMNTQYRKFRLKIGYKI